MKKIKLLIAGILSIVGIGFGFCDFSSNGVTYGDGFYRNQALGLISVIYGENVVTLQDRNLGATSVYDGTINSYGGNISSIRYNLKGDCSQIGNLYQWGNNYGFDCTLPDTFYPFSDSPYILIAGHDYNDSINSSVPYFNRNNYDISDIWGGVTATPSAQQGPCDYGFYVPTNSDWSNFLNMLNDLVPSSNVDTTQYMQKILYYLKFPFISYIQNYSVINYMSAQNVAGIFGYPQSRSHSISFSIPLNSYSYDSLPYYVYTGDYQETFYLSPIRCFKNTPVLPTNTWVSLDGNNDTSIFPNPGDTPQDFESPVFGGIWDYNSMLIEKSILCYMSSGSYGGSFGNCDGINYSGFVNQYNPIYSTWSGSSIEDYYGQLEFSNAQPVLSNYCVNTDLIQYPFCSQLDLYSGAYLLYYFENGKLDYYVLGDGFGVDLGNLGSGQLGELTCQGAWCNNISQGLPEYIIPTNSGNNDFGLSGDIISEDFYNDFISSGFWFSCPYSYSGSYFVLGKDLINRLGGRDLMIPVNCFISAFSMGRKMGFFGDPEYGKYWSGSLISGNTPGHQRLFLFFDLILSLGIIVVLSKLFKLLTTKK